MGFDMEEVRVAAIGWHIRLRDGEDKDWEAFEVWLAQSLDHVVVYREIEDLDHEIEALLPGLVFREAANDTDEETPQSRSSSRRAWLSIAAGSLAACVAGILAFTPGLREDRYEVATHAGENQIVTLDEGTRITLNGSTRMTFDRNDARFAVLTSGEALFHVRHDAARPFRLKVGEDEIEDAGTVFNVVRDGRGDLRVAVAEGSVVYKSGRDDMPLAAGQALSAAGDSKRVRVTSTSAQAVGAWQRGQLVYLGEPLAQVATDLSRSLGMRIEAAPAIAGRPFYGTISMEGTAPEQIERLKLVLNVRLTRGQGGWTMNPVNNGVR